MGALLNMSTRIRFRRDTAANWTSNNPTLTTGELGYETNTGKFKIGNNTNAWTALPYSITAELSEGNLNDLKDVTITSAADGDFLRWNGTAWINDAVNLSTDTIGSYVASLVAGTGVTLTNNSGEGATPTVAVTANTYDAYGSASTTASNAATALTNHEADTTSIHGIADTSILVTTTGSQTLTNKTITSPSGLVKGDVGLGNVDNTADTAKPVSTAQQTALDLKANLASPTLTGVPAAPTASAGNNSTQIATTAYADAAVAALVDSAPATLNTLDELASALGDDANFATTTATSIGLKAPLASPTFTGTVSGITATMVGLGSVDNTADTAKPVSTAQQTALDLKANLASPTFTGTVTLPSGTVTSAMILDGTIANADISTTAAIDLGKLADVSTSAQTASYTLVLADKNKIVEMNVASGNTLTVPLNSSVAFPVGSQINILQTGAGQCTITATGGVTINATPGLKTRAQWSSATLIKRATDGWVLIGDLSA